MIRSGEHAIWDAHMARVARRPAVSALCRFVLALNVATYEMADALRHLGRVGRTARQHRIDAA